MRVNDAISVALGVDGVSDVLRGCGLGRVLASGVMLIPVASGWNRPATGSGGRVSVRSMIFVGVPLLSVPEDVFARTVQFTVVADDVFVVVALPQPAIESR